MANKIIINNPNDFNNISIGANITINIKNYGSISGKLFEKIKTPEMEEFNYLALKFSDSYLIIDSGIDSNITIPFKLIKDIELFSEDIDTNKNIAGIAEIDFLNLPKKEIIDKCQLCSCKGNACCCDGCMPFGDDGQNVCNNCD